jgi:hypothetical protein
MNTPTLQHPTSDDQARAQSKQAAVLKTIRETGKNGRGSQGMMKDSALAKEAWALGETWRNAQTEP